MPAVLLVLACAGAQPAAGAALLASALTLWFHRAHHPHAVSVVAEDGHLHLVLSHGEGSSRDHGRVPQPDDSRSSFSEGDHVFRFGDAAGTAPRRAALDPAPPLAMVVATPPAPAARCVLRSPPEPRPRGVDFLRTVVLRL
jgi:hypothetical protein